MRSLSIIFILVFLSINILGQDLFNITISKPDWDFADAVIERSDGNYLVVGSSRSQSGTDYDINLILIDSLGNIIWDKFIGQSDTLEFAYSLIETSDTNYLVSGRIGNYFPYILMFNKNGIPIWDNRYQQLSLGYGAYSIGETKNNNFFFLESGLPSTLYKVDNFGDTIWTKSFDYACCKSVIQTNDSGFILVGETNITPYDKDIIIIKTNSNADTIWTKKFGDDDDDEGFSVVQYSNDSYLVAGIFRDPFSSDIEPETYFIKLSANGDTLWTRKHFLGTPNFVKICNDSSSFIMSSNRVVYGVFPNLDKFYILISKFDSFGNVVWSKQFEGNTYSIGNNVTQTSDGGYLLTGNIGFPNITDIILIKLDSLGNFILSVTNNNNDMPSFSIKVYPNPASDYIYFDSSNSNTTVEQINLFNSSGKKIFEANNLNEIPVGVNVTNFTNGFYIYKVITKNKSILCGKIMINK